CVSANSQENVPHAHSEPTHRTALEERLLFEPFRIYLRSGTPGTAIVVEHYSDHLEDVPLAGNLPSEVQTLAFVERLAMNSLPPGWSLQATRRPPRHGREPDAVWDIQAPDGSVASFAVEVKRALLGRQLGEVLSQLATFEGLPLVAAAYLSPTLRASLVD